MDINNRAKLREMINEAISWLERYQPNSHSLEEMKRYRREHRRISYSLDNNCAVAAYGESQVGKSYLMSALLAKGTDGLRVVNNGRSYSFVDEINPSGGNTAREETTGIVTRFTIRENAPAVQHLVRVECLSVVDIILILCDAYYRDVKVNHDTALTTYAINQAIDDLVVKYSAKPSVQTTLIDDDIYEMSTYMRDLLGNQVGLVLTSEFFSPSKVARIISSISVDSWAEVFSLLWNRNEHITALFDKLIGAYKRIGFAREVYVPFDAVLKDKGTILKISWLDLLSQTDFELTTGYVRDIEVYDAEAKLLCQDFSKAYLSALTAELSLVIPKEVALEKPFLHQLDLLDLPGARRRESISEDRLSTDVGNLIRRGKVAYLFNKYSRALRISSILFCQHQDQSGQSEMPEALDKWIRENIGQTAESRHRFVQNNAGVSPFFIVGTKFNTELKYTKEQRGTSLDDRWRTRFDKVLSDEIIKPQSYEWFKHWTKDGNSRVEAFKSIYLLRDFFWSRDMQIFAGYKEGVSKECEEIKPEAYPEYREDLRKSFVNYPFVREHFRNPEEAWDSVASLNQDGTEPILRDLSALSTTLDTARREKYSAELSKVYEGVKQILSKYYIPNSEADKRERISRQVKQTRLEVDMLLGRSPEQLGRIVETYILRSEPLRRIAYDIIIRKTEQPVDTSVTDQLRTTAGITPKDSSQEAEAKLVALYGSIENIKQTLEAQGTSLEEILMPSADIPKTLEDLVALRIYQYWVEQIQVASQKLPEQISYRDSIGLVYISMAERRGLRSILRACVADSLQRFRNDQTLQINSIAETAVVLLNNFVTATGSGLLSPEDITEAKVVASTLGLVGFEEKGLAQPQQSDLLETLAAFDQSSDFSHRQRLPWWAESDKWLRSILNGMLLTAEIAHCDHEANDALGAILQRVL